MLSFYLITDLHYFENSLGAEGPAYEARSLTDQKCIAETGAIIDAAFAQLAADRDTNIILIPGDLTFNGEPESHAAMIEKFRALKKLGKEIYIVSGNHDGDHEAYAFRDNEQFTVANVKREDFGNLYHEFGPAQAFAHDDSQTCYVVQLSKTVRMLGVHYNLDENNSGFDAYMPFVLEQIEDAKKHNQLIFGIMHVPVLPGSPILASVGDATIKDGKKFAATLADAGMPLMFTGHMHMQSVNKLVTQKGNFFVDICTGSLVGGPAMVRKITIDDALKMTITSSPSVTDFDLDTCGMTADEYFSGRFERKVKNEITCAIESRKLAQKLINMRLGTLARLLCFRADPSLKDTTLFDMSADIVRRVFYGDQSYTKETPEHIYLMKVLRRLRPIVRMAEKKLAPKQDMFGDIPSLASQLLGKELKIDNHAMIDLTTGAIQPMNGISSN